MVRDLMLAASGTLVIGVTALQGWSHATLAGRDFAAMLIVGMAIAAGPLFLASRRHQPIVPITAIYCVVMFFVVFLVDFVISAYRGQVEL
jgi:hypothetical protein